MAFDPKRPRGLFDLASLDSPRGGLFDLASAKPEPESPFSGLLGPSSPFGSYAPPPQSWLGISTAPATLPGPSVKRKAYFAFHFHDLMRVNNVRQAWKIDHPSSPLMRSFVDSSLWESRQLEGPEAVKRLIREGVEYTSAVCVLVGTHTWSRQWVKYEIARSVIDQRGLLAVHINSLNHHHRRQPDQQGFNPLHLIGVYKDAAGKFYLYEKRQVLNPMTGQTEWQWYRYQDYTMPVALPRYLAEPPVGYIMPLSSATDEYDYVAQTGHKNIGVWIDRAAQRAGR
jgi:hypothetical protein